jgi:DNA polymerase V
MITQGTLIQSKSHSFNSKENRVKSRGVHQTDDREAHRPSLNDYIVGHPASTYFSRVAGEECAALGLHPGDLLVIDRSLAPRHNCLVIADVDGEFCVCRLLKQDEQWVFESGNGTQITVSFGDNFQSPIWGRITHVVHEV